MQIVIVIFDYKTVSDKKKHLVIASFHIKEKLPGKEMNNGLYLLLNVLHNFLDSVSVCWLKPFSLLVLKMLSSGGRSPKR